MSQSGAPDPYAVDTYDGLGTALATETAAGDPTYGNYTNLYLRDATGNAIGYQHTTSSSTTTDVLTADGHGNITAETGPATTNIAPINCSTRYDPYGSTESLSSQTFDSAACSNGTTSNSVLYGGQRRDTVTGSYQLGARTYSPTRNTYNQADSPQATGSSDDPAVGSDPLTANTYTYVNGDPLNDSDPTGHALIPQGAGDTVGWSDTPQDDDDYWEYHDNIDTTFKHAVEGAVDGIADLPADIYDLDATTYDYAYTYTAKFVADKLQGKKFTGPKPHLAKPSSPFKCQSAACKIGKVAGPALLLAAAGPAVGAVAGAIGDSTEGAAVAAEASDAADTATATDTGATAGDVPDSSGPDGSPASSGSEPGGPAMSGGDEPTGLEPSSGPGEPAGQTGDGAAGATAAEPQGGVYTLRDPETNEVVRTGRSVNLADREVAHANDPVLGDFEFNVEYRTNDYATQRGLEQILYDQYPGAQASNGGYNFIRGISPTNVNGPVYMRAAENFLVGLGGD